MTYLGLAICWAGVIALWFWAHTLPETDVIDTDGEE